MIFNRATGHCPGCSCITSVTFSATVPRPPPLLFARRYDRQAGFPEEAQAAPAAPMRTPGVQVGMRWREYQTRR